MMHRMFGGRHIMQKRAQPQESIKTDKH